MKDSPEVTKHSVMPEFTEHNVRNQWIIEHADYFTVIRRKDRRYERSEAPTFDEAVYVANKIIAKYPDSRMLIYAVHGQHDALAATISSTGIKRHT